MAIVDNKEDGFTKEVSEYPCSGLYYLNELHDVSCKTCFFMPMQSKDNDKIFHDTHDVDAPMRCMIAMVVQRDEGRSRAQMKWCI